MYTRNRPKIERIGKKYQWLALGELLSKIADNYWLEGEYGMLPKAYASPLDIGFVRDIDPTILAETGKSQKSLGEPKQLGIFSLDRIGGGSAKPNFLVGLSEKTQP